MRIAFRTDASIKIGNGHVMRCLTLASALRERGAACFFICRLHEGHLADKIQQQGFEVTSLPAPAVAAASGDNYAQWLGVSYETDALQTQAALGNKVDWLVVDHYALDARWESEMRSVCQRVMAIDDLAQRNHHCDILLDQNVGRNSAHYQGLVPEHCSILAGPAHALLRPEFAASRELSLGRRKSSTLRKLLISMGGVDKDNSSGRILAELRSCTLPADTEIAVVLGPHAPFLSAVRAAAADMPWQTRVLVDVQDIAGLMAQSDLAIGAAGGSALERCCVGLPSVVIPLADNQLAGAAALARSGAVQLATIDVDGPDGLLNALTQFTQTAALHSASVAAAAITDGHGAARTAALMTGTLHPHLRAMRESDLDLVLAWRNAPAIRCCMLNTEEITPAAHADWFHRTSNNPDRALLIVEANAQPIGFVQFSGINSKPVTEWGFYAAPTAPKGSGSLLGKLALEFAFSELRLKRLRGQTLTNNVKSIRFHQKLGFIQQAQHGVASEKNAARDLLSFDLTRAQWEKLQDTTA